LDIPHGQSERYGDLYILETTGTRTLTPRSSSPQPVIKPTALLRHTFVSEFILCFLVLCNRLNPETRDSTEYRRIQNYKIDIGSDHRLPYKT
jgi:hypothetical protein